MEACLTEAEIIQFAIDKELDDYELYSRLAGDVEDPISKQMLLDLAHEEKEHQKRLELEMMKLGHVVKSDENMERLRRRVMEVAVDGDMSWREILGLAITKERADFRLYVYLSNLSKAEPHRDMLLSLAQEEVRHSMVWENAYEEMLKDK